ncbi:glycosyltransferase [Clostridium beijerinckii]|uniref:glycosyltransferase n=1 Tax=Clostridium beijerinckii TaxID=1520 RepID=UPI0003D35BBB|nr:glycosyltransferase family 2 protein [Clostridium beijerinckii]ALB44531.1 glycosyltransferase family 2 protein [Clostridium beijerinckii NRRL B-598]
MLSLCMIVKNEEQNLKKCLLNVETIVDEIIIVDTGSIDNTKTIALEFTDKVYDFQWCDDFSAARNFSISKATNDWILILDADEFVEGFNKEKILDFIRSADNIKNVGRIKLYNVIDDSLGTKRSSERISRLFNKTYFYYEGTIHEQIASIDKKKFKTIPIDITVNHIGYLKEELNRANKLYRNINLLTKAICNNLKDPYLYYQLGKSYYLISNYEKSYQCFKKSLSFQLNYRLEYVEDLIKTYGYALINAGKFKEAMNIEEYGKYYKDNADYDFLMGIIYMNNAKFNSAVESFLKCTKSDKSKIEGVNSYLSYYNIGVIFECLGYRDESITYYRKCKNYELAVIRIKVLLG